MLYGVLVPQQQPEPTPPPRWYVRLRNWINKFRKGKAQGSLHSADLP
jgi:hypothetical protein